MGETNLHEHVSIIRHIGIGLLFILFFVYISIHTKNGMLTLSVVENLDGFTKWFYYSFNVVKFVACLVIFDLFGFLADYLTFDDKNNNNISDELVVFRFVTRGTSPHLIRVNLQTNWKILKKYQNFIKIEIVTDIAININPLEYGIPNNLFNEIIVPSDYSTPNKTLFKAKALHYASLNSKFSSNKKNKNCWIFHCDEESLVTDSLLFGVKEFILNPKNKNKIGQGLITWKNNENTLVSYLCHLCEAIRIAMDLGRLKFQFKILNKIRFWIKGSFILVPNKIEMKQSTSFDCCGEYGSICEDSWWAYTQNMNNNKFGWCNGVLIEQSAFIVKDIIQQRRRWNTGLTYLILHHPAKWYTKILLVLSEIGRLVAWMIPSGTIINIIYFGYHHYHIISIINDLFLIILSVMVLMGHLLLIHKNYFEKIVLLLFLPILMPIIFCIESIGQIYGYFYPDNKFCLVQKEGNSLKKLMKSS